VTVLRASCLAVLCSGGGGVDEVVGERSLGERGPPCCCSSSAPLEIDDDEAVHSCKKSANHLILINEKYI